MGYPRFPANRIRSALARTDATKKQERFPPIHPMKERVMLREEIVMLLDARNEACGGKPIDNVAPVKPHMILLSESLQTRTLVDDAMILPRPLQHWTKGCLQNGMPSWFQNASNFRKRALIILHMFKYMIGDHQIKRCILEWHCSEIGTLDIRCGWRKIAFDMKPRGLFCNQVGEACFRRKMQDVHAGYRVEQATGAQVH